MQVLTCMAMKNLRWFKMKKILNHLMLAFIFATQSFFLIGCSHKIDQVQVTCDCGESKFECLVNEKNIDIDPN